MPRKKAAAPAAAPATPPLDGCVLAFSGTFAGHSHSALEQYVTTLGASTAKSVTKATTHLIASQDDFNRGTAKVSAAQKKNIPIISLDWAQECERKGTNVDTENYVLKPSADDEDDEDDDEPPAVNGGSAMNGSATNGSQAKTSAAAGTTSRRKRPIAVANPHGDVDDDEKDAPPKSKKTKKTSEPEETAEPPKVKETVAEGQIAKKQDAKIPIDEGFQVPGYFVYIDGDGLIWDATLNQANSGQNNNKFYRLQVLHKPQAGTYITFTRWGRVGSFGQTAQLGSGPLEEAIKHFEKKFKDKTKLKWADRNSNPHPGSYAFIEKSYDPDSDNESDDAKSKGDVKKEEDEEDYTPPECTLEKPVQELMELIFNQQFFNAAMANLNYDANKMPLGKLSKNTILRGFQALKDIAAILDDPTIALSQHNLSTAGALEHFSNLYYTLIPHAFGRNRIPVIRDNNLLKKEIELLESLSDMKDANDIMKLDRKKDGPSVHPANLQFSGLGLREMTVLDPKSKEFELLGEYLNGSKGQTHGMQYDISQIFRIERDGEHKRFSDSKFASIKSDKRLLWHGSRCTNFGGILSQGLRIAPPEAPVSGYMFGKGIYLADMSTKSAGYCASYISNEEALLLLCEAELGDPMQKLVNASYNAGIEAQNKGMVSTWGQGTTGPMKWKDASCVHKSLKGIKMPDPAQPPSQTSVVGAGLYYNEYICYDVAQVKLRYLFRVKISYGNN